jgi:hypothetical protein
MPEKPEKTIVDASVPNAGRIYDYLLGGHHNFEVDRQAGDRLKEILPIMPKAMRLMRWCLQDVARELTEERGFDTIIDFASGLPTMDHLHSAVAPGTTIIYSDRDSVTVEYGREILSNTPDVYYFQADCRWPEQLLDRPEVQDILGDNRHVAFVYWGISMYLTDEDIAHAAHTLYDWSDEASCLAFFLSISNPEDPSIAKHMEIYRQMGEELHFRPLEVYRELIKPWRPDNLGYRTLREWHGIELELTAADQQAYAGAGEPSGVYLIK